MSVIKPQEINLDFSQNYYKDIVIKQNDVNSRTVIVTCTDNGIKCLLDRITQTCNIKMETPDGRPIYNSTTILSDGRVQIVFTEQMVLVSGIVEAELQVIDSSSQEIIHTMNLYIVIESNVYPNDAIIASPEFEALNKALLAVQDCSELVESVHEIEANEKEREENEAKRSQEFAEMKEVLDEVADHYNIKASVNDLGHVRVDGITITIDEDGVISSIGGNSSEVPDGVTYIDFTDSEETETNVVIDTLKTKNELGEEYLLYPRSKTTAIINDEGKTLDTILSELNSDSSSSGGFNEIYAETSINMGREADTVIGENSIAIGYKCEASGDYSFANGQYCIASGRSSHSENYNNKATGDYSHAEGNDCTASGLYSHAEGLATKAIGRFSHAENNCTYAEGDGSHTEGNNTRTTSTAVYGHAEGYNSQAQGYCSHAEGNDTRAIGTHAHAEGNYSKAEGFASHAEGNYTNATGNSSHAEGDSTKAIGISSHAEGLSTEASGAQSHAEGSSTKAIGYNSHAEGGYTEAKGGYSHAEGDSTIASGNAQHVQGKYNVEDIEGKYVHIVGGGTNSERKNIHTLDWEGNAIFTGTVMDGNGATIGGIETNSKNVLNSKIESPIVVNSIVGNFNQITTRGKQLYNFTDITEVQNGINITFKDGIGTATGTPTVTSGTYFEIQFNEPITNLNDGWTYNSMGYCSFKVILKDGTTQTLSSVRYDSSVIENVYPVIKVESYNYQDGMVIKPMIYNGSHNGWEPYTGGVQSPSPLCKQTLEFPLFTTVNISTESESCNAKSSAPIILCGMNGVVDEIKNNKLTKRFEVTTLNGTQDITIDSITGCFLYTPVIEAKSASSNIASDSYKYFETNTYDTNYGIFILDGGIIGIKHDGFSTVDEYKDWLASNNVTIVYERATEEAFDLDEEFINELNKLKLFVGENTIATNSATIHPIIEFDYATSKMAKYVMELLEKVKTLESNASILSSILNVDVF